MGLIEIILLSVLGAAFVAGGIVVYRKSEGTGTKAVGAAAIAAGIVMLAIVLFVTPVFQQTSNAPEGSIEYTTPVNDYESLLSNLNATGASVEPDGELMQPFFSAPGKVININGSDVQVFEYPDRASAEAEATLVSPDGSSIGTSMVGWIESPHFFKTDKLIVLYVGTNAEVISVLESVLGAQFAGR